ACGDERVEFGFRHEVVHQVEMVHGDIHAVDGTGELPLPGERLGFVIDLAPDVLPGRLDSEMPGEVVADAPAEYRAVLQVLPALEEVVTREGAKLYASSLDLGAGGHGEQKGGD